MTKCKYCGLEGAIPYYTSGKNLYFCNQDCEQAYIEQNSSSNNKWSPKNRFTNIRKNINTLE